MKRALIICLAVLTLLTLDNSAEAGRRKDRRAEKKGGGGIYSGAYSRGDSNSGSNYSVAKASYATPAAAAVPTPAVAPVPTSVPTPAPAAPDLTITEIAAIGDVLAFTVQNIGQVASPETRLEVALAQPTQAGPPAMIESQNVRVLPLLPGQSVRIRLHSVPQADIHADALVDPDHLVAESNEQNNDLRVTLATEKVAEVPPTLADDSTWSQAGN